MLLKLLKGVLGKRPEAAAAPVPPPPPQQLPAAKASDPREELADAMRKEVELRALIDHCYGRMRRELAPSTREAVEASAARFPAPSVSGLNIFVYHVDMGNVELQYRDMNVDPSRFDYQAVLRAFIDSVRRWHADANIYLVTNTGSPLAAFAGERVHVVELEAAADQTMYQRVRAMCAYVHSRAFTADTLFLDSDAFLNAPAEAWMLGDFDLAVTFRNRLWFMPVNEGVMAAKAARPEAVRAFFCRYLATYDELVGDAKVQAFYGDIRRWRGGQLSLNAVTRGGYPYSTCRGMFLDGIVVKALPADCFNYSSEAHDQVDVRAFDARAVVHLKGYRKESLDAWLAYAATRGDAACAA